MTHVSVRPTISRSRKSTTQPAGMPMISPSLPGSEGASVVTVVNVCGVVVSFSINVVSCTVPKYQYS